MTTWTVGQLVTAALMNSNIQALGNFVLAPPLAGMVQNTTQSLSTSGTYFDLLLDTNVLDSDGGHSTISNTAVYTIQVAGTYLVWAGVSFASNTTSGRAIRMVHNSNPIQGSGAWLPTLSTGGNTSFGSIPQMVACAVGDTIKAQILQSSGGALSTNSATEFACTMNILRVSN